MQSNVKINAIIDFFFFIFYYPGNSMILQTNLENCNHEQTFNKAYNFNEISKFCTLIEQSKLVDEYLFIL